MTEPDPDNVAERPLSQRRHKARHYALQAIYRWQLNGGSASEIEAEFRTDYDLAHTDLAYFRALIDGVIVRTDEIDAAYGEWLDRSRESLDQVERALLRLATFELIERIDVPYKVVIDEAVGLAKKFGATDSYKYVNGVLDHVARRCRATETGAG